MLMVLLVVKGRPKKSLVMSHQNFQQPGVSVTVNSGPSGYVPGNAVTVRPILPTAQPSIPRQQLIAKVVVRV